MPSRHGVHCPQDSWWKKRSSTISVHTMHVRSSITMTPADPRKEPAFCTESMSIGTSISAGVKTGIEAPPGMTAFSSRPPAMPPAWV